MTDFELLYQDMLAHKNDLGPRRVLADWYAKNGDPDRAEFISIQCSYTDPHFDGTCLKCGVAPLRQYIHSGGTYSFLCRYCNSSAKGRERITLAPEDTAKMRCGIL